MSTAYQQLLTPETVTTLSDILDSCNIALSDILPADWAEKNITMPQGSAYPGKFSYNLTPYWREVVNHVWKHSPVKSIAVMKGAQIGYSAAVLMPFVGYVIAENPGPFLFLTGHSDLSKEAVEAIDHMIDNAGLRKYISSQLKRVKNQRTGDTGMFKEFRGGNLRGGSITNHNMLRQRTAKYGSADDYSAAPRSAKDTGSTRRLFQQRFSAYFDNGQKIIYGSSPQLKGHDNTEDVYLLGDQRRYNLPCPLCGALQPLEWSTPFIGSDGKPHNLPDTETGKPIETAGIYYQVDTNNKVLPHTVGYVCRHCAGFFTEKHKYEMNLAGQWVPTAAAKEADLVSYQISSLYAPPGMYNWTYYAQQHAEANPPGQPQNIALQQTFVNVALGLTFEVPAEEPQGNQLQNNIQPYPIGTIPAHLAHQHGNGPIVLITCAVDLNGTEDDARLDYEIVAWAQSGAQYSITHGSIGTFVPRENTHRYKQDRERFTYRHYAPNSVWPHLQQILQTKYPVQPAPGKPAKQMGIFITAIDTGHYTTHAYQFIDLNKTQHNVIGIKGDKEKKYRKFGIDTPTFTKAKERDRLYILEVNQIKDNLAQLTRLTWDAPNQPQQPPGYLNYPTPSEGKYLYPNYFSHYEAEHRKTETKEGEGIAARWEKKNSAAQNHFWDIRVYHLALRDIFTYLFFTDLKLPDPARRTWADYCNTILAKIK